MFTVIICDKSVIKDCTNKYRIHLKPLLEKTNYAFCEWNPYGATLDEAVPGLEKVISIKKEWRAVIVADSHAGVLDYTLTNPFDYVRYRAFTKDTDIDSREKVIDYREYVEQATEKAMTNPLMKLSMWLSGSVVKLRPFEPPQFVTDYDPSSDDYEAYQKAIEEEDYSLLNFEKMRARVRRFDRLTEKFSVESEMFNPPKQVIAIAERAVNTALTEDDAAWGHHSDFDYSGFAEDNMYSGKLRFVTYEMKRIRKNIKQYDYFVFLVTLMVFAQNDFHSDYLKPEKVYALYTDVSDERISQLCNTYLKKLVVTLRDIANLHRKRYMESSKKLDDLDAEREFESDISIPVNVDKQYEKESLMCEHDHIGLATDCPDDERTRWLKQHKAIRRHFTRFLRQPQRSIEKAVEGDFREQDGIDGERAKLLTKYQRQDVVYKLYDEEQQMIEIDTPGIFDKAGYDGELDEANKSILRNIDQRMSRKKVIFTGLLPLILFLIGFIPLIVSEYNNYESGLYSVSLTVAATAILLAVTVVMMLIFRNRLISCFKQFNHVMGRIYDGIISSLGKFSKYLSSACNVKREFAVIDAIDNDTFDYHKIYRKHEIDIERNMSNVMTLFNDFVEEDFAEKIDDDITPYPFNFDKPVTYPYDLPYNELETEIEFLKRGNRVSVPIDFLNGITLKREELYD